MGRPHYSGLMIKLGNKLIFGVVHKLASVKTMFGSMDKDYVSKLLKQGGAGLFFSICSILIVFINKLVLTTYRLVSGRPFLLTDIITLLLQIPVLSSSRLRSGEVSVTSESYGDVPFR